VAHVAKTSSATEDNFSHLADTSQNPIFSVLRQMTKGPNDQTAVKLSSVAEDVFGFKCLKWQNQLFE
jgi:hypothetical protein